MLRLMCRWEQEEQEMRQIFDALLVGPKRGSGGGGDAGGGASRSSRALLRAKERAVVTPEDRDAMADLARREMVSRAKRRRP